MKTSLYILSALFVLAAPLAVFAQDAAPKPPAAPSALEGWSIPEEEAPDQEKGPAGAAEQPKTGAELKALGEESYSVGDYEKALDLFNEALPLLETASDKAKVHERLGYIYAAFGKTDDVYNEFVESLKLDPGLEMDPNQVSPKIYEAYKKAREVVVREGTLYCNCDPAGAQVYIGDTLLGEAPVRKEHIPEGDYTLTLKKPGYEPSIGKVSIKKDVTLTVEDKLVEARGEVTINTTPPGSRVVFDGRDEGPSPVTVGKVSGGSHALLVKRDYFDPGESTVTIEKAEKKSVDVTLKRRLLLIGVGDGKEDGDGLSPSQDGLLTGPFSKMEDLRVIPAGMKYLEKGLSERGLEPGSLQFIREQHARLSLQDSAALSGIMEKEGAELALAARLSEGERKTLTLTLYSIMSDMGDVVVLKSADMDGLAKGLDGFLLKWQEQEGMKAPAIGARLVDRADAGAEVISVLPGLPAASAGLIPGDIIKGYGPAEIKEKRDLISLLKPGEKREIKFVERGKRQSASIIPVEAPAETPLDSEGYLYNLALVDFAAPQQASAGQDATKKPDGLDSLNLGNVYFHLGDYEKAIKAYRDADTGTKSGVCTGTALYRMGQAYEKLNRWVDAAGSYRKSLMLYPYATIENADGPYVAPLAKERLQELFKRGLVKERWWM